MTEIKVNICSKGSNWNFIISLCVCPHTPYICSWRNLNYAHINMWEKTIIFVF